MRTERCRGFTLLEVLVALIIASLALAAAMASISQMVDAGITLRERTYASWIAENEIARLRLENVTPEVDDTSGEVEFADLEWRWEATVSETGAENLYRVDVEVYFAGSDELIRRTSGFIGEPAIPGEANRAWSVGGQPVGEQQ